MNEFTLTVLAVSIIMQLTAAIFAVRLNRKSSKVGHAWLLIAAALTLMATRRIVTFVGFFVPQVEATVKGPVAESIALMIAILMLAGVLLIPRVFISLQQVTEALRASEARYRALVDSAEDIIFSLDRNGRYTAINASTLRRFDLAEADFVGKTIRDFYPPEEATFYEMQHAQVLATGQPIRFERHSVNALGDFWLSTALSPIFDATGEVVAISGVSHNITERVHTEEELKTRVRQQAVVAKLGQRALAGTDLSTLIDEAVATIAQILAIEYVKVLELLPDGDTSFLRAGVGWQEGLVGKARVGVGTDSQAGYTLLSSTPVIVEDLRLETRFSGPMLLHDHGVVSGMSVIIAGQEHPFGILGAHTTQQRPFTEDDVYFLQAVANVLAEAIERQRAEQALRQSADQLTALHEIALDITIRRDMVELLDATVIRAANLLGVSGGSVYIVNPNGETLTLTAVHDDGKEFLGTQLRRGEGMAGWVLESRQPLVVEDYDQWEGKATTYPVGLWGSIVEVPLLAAEQVIGVLSCYEAPGIPHTFSEADVQLLEGLARQVAIAIENAQLFATATRRSSELSVLMRLGQAISANLDLDTILETTYQGVGTLMDNDAFWISSYGSDSEFSQYLIKIDRGVHHALDQFSINAGIGGYVLRTEKPVSMDRPTLQDKFTAARYGDSDPVESVLCVPLRMGNRIIGVMSTQSYTPDAYSQKELTLLTQLAQPVAIAMENARLFTAERAARRQAETLQEATQALSRSLNLSQVFEMILSELQQVVPYDSATVQQLKEEHLEIIGGYGFPNLDKLLGVSFDLTAGDNPNREVVSTQATFIVDDAPAIYSDFSVALHAKAGIRSWLGVPLLFGDRLIGMLALDKQEVGFYTQEHARLALGFAAQAAIAIENAKLYDQLNAHATTLEQRVAERTHELGKANEQLKELDRLKSKFVSDVSHELRTPVTNLRMYLDLLERGQPERHARYISILQEQAGQLQHLIEGILDLSRLEIAKDTKIAFSAVDLNELVAQVVTVHQPRAEVANLHFTFAPDVDLPPIQGERNQLIQVVTNLVINALNYTPAGSIQVSTYLDGDQVCLQVVDTGIGIDPTDLSHLFERFYRGQHTRQLTIPGTGLGLGIVKEIVDLHKGEIEVQSEVGIGTTFRVCFPAAI